MDGARDVAIEFHSLSKTYNMTGWRCGWAVGRPELAGVLAKVKSFIDTGAFMAVQAAGIAALESWSDFLPGNLEIFRARRDAAVSAFRANGFACEVPRATMYLWVTLPDGIASAAFAERLMSDEGVIVLPGAAFGAAGEGFFRVSFIVHPERRRKPPRAPARLASFGVGRVKPRVDGSVAVSIALTSPRRVLLWVFSSRIPCVKSRADAPRVAPEQISFISIPNRARKPGRSGGDGLPERPNSPPRPAQPLVAPSATPSVIPPAPATPRREDVGGSGPLVGRGGPVRGIVPSYSDPRVWADPNAQVLALPRSLSEQLDSMLVTGTQRVRDSMALASGQRKPGDWSWTKDGKKYGWDAEGIHLGESPFPTSYSPGAALAQGGISMGSRRTACWGSSPRFRDAAGHQLQRAPRHERGGIPHGGEAYSRAEGARRREAREESEKKAKEQKSAAP